MAPMRVPESVKTAYPPAKLAYRVPPAMDALVITIWRMINALPSVLRAILEILPAIPAYSVLLLVLSVQFLPAIVRSASVLNSNIKMVALIIALLLTLRLMDLVLLAPIV